MDPGTYEEDVVIPDRGLVLRGTQGWAATSVRSMTLGDATNGPGAVVEGFRISGNLLSSSSYWDGPFRVQDLYVIGSAAATGYADGRFVACTFCLGLSANIYRNDTAHCYVDRCALPFGGTLSISTDGWAGVSRSQVTGGGAIYATGGIGTGSVDSCSIDVGSITAEGEEGWATRCTIGHGDLVIHGSSWGVYVDGNVLEDGDIHVSASGTGNKEVRGNLLWNGALSVVGHGMLVHHNELRNGGIDYDDFAGSIEQNVISGGDVGIRTLPNQVHGNVISNCRVAVQCLPWAPDINEMRLSGNTIVDCDSAGVDFGEWVTGEISNNIVVGCGRGIVLGGDNSGLTLACNDVWHNPGGDWVGVGDPTGENGNISEDPLFCNAPALDYNLAPDSPCAPEQNPACGLIGALGVGDCPAGACCGVDGSCTVELEPDCQPPRSWLGGGTACSPNFCLPTGACCFPAACDLSDREWCANHEGTYQGDGTTCEPDPCLTSGLRAGDGGGDAPAIEVTPNPAAQEFVLRFHLSEPAEVTIEIYNVSGRLVHATGRTVREPGVQAVTWDCRDLAGLQVPSGTYFMRLHAGNRTSGSRMVVAK